MLASHEVGTSPKPSKSIHMVSGPMLVEVYSMRQQSAIMVSEYLPSFESGKSIRRREEDLCETLTLEDQSVDNNHRVSDSPLHRRPL